MFKTRPVVALTLAALLSGIMATGAEAATLAAWRAPVGSAGYNGYATIVTNATGTGVLKVVAKRLARRVTYPIEIRSGSCTGTRLFALPSVVSSSTGTIVKSHTLSTTRAAQVARTSKPYIRIGSSSRARCGRFSPTIPTGAVSGTTVRVPAGPYGDALHLHTVQVFEPWTPALDSPWQPDPGNVFVTVLVRVDAKGTMTYNPFDYRVRDADGLQYSPTIGREPALHAGDLSSGTFVAGWVTFEVPAGQAASLILVYSPTFGATVLIGLTPLASDVPSPTPTPAPTPMVAPCPPGPTIGSQVTIGNSIQHVDSFGQWAGSTMITPSPGHVFVTAWLEGTLANEPIPMNYSYSLQSSVGNFPAFPPDRGRQPAIDLNSTPLGFSDVGYVTFDVPPAVLAGRLSIGLLSTAGVATICLQ